MLKETLEVSKKKQRVFQVLLLNNDQSQEVEVEESEEIDFSKVQEYLKQGGSVFITSRNSQKLSLPEKSKKAIGRIDENKATATIFYFDHM